MPAVVPQIKLSAVVKELVEAGVAGTDLVAAIERIENSAEPVRLVDAQADQRRAKDRARKRQARLRNSADTKDETEKEPPQTPKRKIIYLPDLTVRTRQARQASGRDCSAKDCAAFSDKPVSASHSVER